MLTKSTFNGEADKRSSNYNQLHGLFLSYERDSVKLNGSFFIGRFFCLDSLSNLRRRVIYANSAQERLRTVERISTTRSFSRFGDVFGSCQPACKFKWMSDVTSSVVVVIITTICVVE